MQSECLLCMSVCVRACMRACVRACVCVLYNRCDGLNKMSHFLHVISVAMQQNSGATCCGVFSMDDNK